MDLHIYDSRLNELGIADEFKSIIWTRRFYDVGAFEIQAPMTANNIALFQKNRYVYRPDVKEAGFIRSITEQRQGDEELIIVSGAMLEGLLDKRMIALPVPTGTFSLNSMLSWLNYDSESDFKFDNFYFYGGKMDYTLQAEANKQNMGEYVRNMLYNDGYKIKIDMDIDQEKILGYYYKGTNRSTDQEENPHIIFSEEYGNISNKTYNYSDEGCHNYVRVTADLTSASYTEHTGTIYPLYIEKRETDSNGEPVCGLGMSMYYCYSQPVINKVQRTDPDGNTYTVNVLDFDATKIKQEELIKQYYCPYSENFEGDISGDGYRTEWQVGDYITVEDTARGISYKKQIEEVSEAFEGDSVSVTVTLGAALKTLIDSIKEAKK